MPVDWTQFQPGVFASPGSDLYNQRVAYNQSLGVRGGTPGLETGIAGNVNRFMAGQAEMPFLTNLSLYQPMREEQSQGILDELQGNFPKGVLDQIIRVAAERGIISGNRGQVNASLLNLTKEGSYGLIKEGRNALNTAMQQTPVPELWNPMSLYVPERLGKLELETAKQATSPASNKPWGYPEDTVPPWLKPSSWGW